VIADLSVFLIKILKLQWDILSNGGAVQEMAHIANGRDHGNCVSLLRVNVSARNTKLHPISSVKFLGCR
jgi:hypothetical protein